MGVLRVSERDGKLPVMTTLTKRAAMPEDLERVLDLYRHLDPTDERSTPERAQQIHAQLRLFPGSEILIGELGADLVASCTLIIIPNLTRGGTPFGLIENVVTHEAYRGKGYGREVLDEATERAWVAGCYKLMLMTGSQKTETLRFYEKAGFSASKTGFQKRRVPVRPD